MDESNSSKTLAKHNKYRKAKYTSQDFRAKAIEARDELQANVDFLMEVIRKDRYRLKHYEEQFGDLYYRPIVSKGSEDGSIEPKYGNPTEIVLEPLASKYRATIKSLLDSIKLINTELLPEDNPEGETTQPSEERSEATQKRQSLRDQFKSMSENPSAFKPAEPEALDNEEELENLTNQVKQGLADADQGRVKPTKEVKAQVQGWKSTTPRAQAKLIQKNPVVAKEPSETKPKEEAKAVIPRGMLDRLKVNEPKRESSLDRIRAQYGISKKSKDDSDDEDV